MDDHKSTKRRLSRDKPHPKDLESMPSSPSSATSSKSPKDDHERHPENEVTRSIMSEQYPIQFAMDDEEMANSDDQYKVQHQLLSYLFPELNVSDIKPILDLQSPSPSDNEGNIASVIAPITQSCDPGYSSMTSTHQTLYETTDPKYTLHAIQDNYGLLTCRLFQANNDEISRREAQLCNKMDQEHQAYAQASSNIDILEFANFYGLRVTFASRSYFYLHMGPTQQYGGSIHFNAYQ
ncbi:hypothetical protein BGZ76_008436 [Entomortierella beljakovae]|nr:hypothetical protein BGZ76_008436 [Entomortierella beljakovae]